MNLILGTANFCNDYGKRIERDDCFKILDRAKELGVWAVDTAQSYVDSSKIIQEWNRLPIFSKYKGDEEYPSYANYVLLHDEQDLFSKNLSVKKHDGYSIYDVNIVNSHNKWIQAPFNPLNFKYRCWADYNKFIARSIFLGSKFYGNSDRKVIAKLTFGFLRSHNVKNVVFGVDSIEDLEINVEAARDTKIYDTRCM